MMDVFPQFLRDHNYFAVYLLMMLDAFFPIFPSEMVMGMAGLLASQGAMTLPGAIAAGTAGALTGALIWYVLGRFLGLARFSLLMDRIGWLTTIKMNEIDRLSRWFERFGTPIVFFARMVPLVRTAISIPAGLVKLNFFTFLVLTVIGDTIWSSLLAVAGWKLGTHYYEVIHAWLGDRKSVV